MAIVTGAAGGLGAAMAAGLARDGWRVAAVHHREPPADHAGPGTVALAGDVTSEADCARVVAETVRRLGRPALLVNNAGVSHQAFPGRHDTDLADVTPDAWRRVMEVNVNGTYLMTRAALPAILAGGWGRVVNVTTSKATMLRATFLPYGASKAAVEAMTASWAERLRGTGVTVNALLPGGPCDTPAQRDRDRSRMWPAELMVPPLLWLASAASGGVTGHRFVARLWDPALPAGAAAVAAGFAAGWPVEAHDHALDREGHG